MVFPLEAVTLDADVAILGVQNLPIGRPGASFYHLGDDFVSLETPWGTMGAAGRTHESPELDDGKHSLECLELQLESFNFQIDGFGETRPGSRMTGETFAPNG